MELPSNTQNKKNNFKRFDMIKSKKNHYKELGFLTLNSDGQNLYELEVDNYENKEYFITTK